MISYLAKLFSYVAPVGQQPWLDLLFLKNPIVLLLDKLGFSMTAFPVATFAKRRMAERLSEMDTNKANGVEPSTGRADLLSMFLKAKADRPDFFNDQRVLTMAVSMGKLKFCASLNWNRLLTFCSKRPPPFRHVSTVRSKGQKPPDLCLGKSLDQGHVMIVLSAPSTSTEHGCYRLPCFF